MVSKQHMMTLLTGMTESSEASAVHLWQRVIHVHVSISSSLYVCQHLVLLCQRSLL